MCLREIDCYVVEIGKKEKPSGGKVIESRSDFEVALV